MNRRLVRIPLPDWRNWPVAAIVGLAPIMLPALEAAGIRHMRDLDGLTEIERRDRVPGLTDGQHDRITSLLAECRDDEIVHRSRHLGEPE